MTVTIVDAVAQRLHSAVMSLRLSTGVRHELGCNLVGPLDMLPKCRRTELPSVAAASDSGSVLDPHLVAMRVAECRVARAAGWHARLTMRVRPIMALLRDAISVSQVSRIDMLRWHASPCATGSDVVNIKGTLHKQVQSRSFDILGTTRMWRL
jgi:hypothetical protein